MSKQVFQIITDKINLIRKPLKVNTASRATLGPIEITPLYLNIEEQNCLDLLKVLIGTLMGNFSSDVKAK